MARGKENSDKTFDLSRGFFDCERGVDSDIMKKKMNMSESVACINATSALLEIRTLKVSFEQAYDAAIVSEDEANMQRAQAMKIALETKITALNEVVWSAEVERVFDLRKQYESQRSLLKKADILKTKTVRNVTRGEYELDFILGDDLKEYPLPSYRDIVRGMMEKKELHRLKADQGFTKLLIVPFAMDLMKIIDRFESYLKARSQDKKNHFDLNLEDPIEIDLRYRGSAEDAYMDELVYHPKNMEADGRGGSTKKQILETQYSQNDWHQGFEFIFVQNDVVGESIRSIPWLGEGSSKAVTNGRADIGAGKSADEYVSDMVVTQTDPHSAYFGESGMTLEAWITGFMTQLEERGMPLDALSAGDCTVRLTGAYFTRNDQFICAYWDGDEAKAKIVSESSNNKDSVSGARMVVRI